MNKSQLIEFLKKAPQSSIDMSLMPQIRLWDENVEALEVLQVLDKATRFALASSFAIRMIQSLYEECLKIEGVDHSFIVSKADWRKQND